MTNQELNLILDSLETAKEQLKTFEFGIRHSELIDFYMTLSKVDDAINLVKKRTNNAKH